jgi:hypothetical protein
MRLNFREEVNHLRIGAVTLADVRNQVPDLHLPEVWVILLEVIVFDFQIEGSY